MQAVAGPRLSGRGGCVAVRPGPFAKSLFSRLLDVTYGEPRSFNRLSDGLGQSRTIQSPYSFSRHERGLALSMSLCATLTQRGYGNHHRPSQRHDTEAGITKAGRHFDFSAKRASISGKPFVSRDSTDAHEAVVFFPRRSRFDVAPTAAASPWSYIVRAPWFPRATRPPDCSEGLVFFSDKDSKIGAVRPGPRHTSSGWSHALVRDPRAATKGILGIGPDRSGGDGHSSVLLVAPSDTSGALHKWHVLPLAKA
jgi:hypothetical protein